MTTQMLEDASREAPVAEPSVACGREACKEKTAEPHAPNPWDRPCSFVLLSIWFGLLAGFVEAAVCWLAFSLQNYPLSKLNPFGCWMLPVADGAIFAAVGLVFALLSWICLRSRWLFPAMGLFTFALSFGAVSLLSSRFSLGVHPLAVLLLALGVAARLVVWAEKHHRGFHAFVLRTTVLMAVSVGALAAGTFGGRLLAERAMLANRPAASADAPNVILLVLDTVRAESMSLYGYSRDTTPNLRQWAKRGVVFNLAISPSPWTLPAHASMFTGKYPFELSSDFCSPLDRNDRTLAEELYERGYGTAGFAGNTYYCGRRTGLDRGFVHYQADGLRLGDFVQYSFFARFVAEMFRDKLGYYDAWWNRTDAKCVNSRFLKWLSQQPEEQPFFAFINYFDCHDTYLPTRLFGQSAGCLTTEVKRSLKRYMPQAWNTADFDGRLASLAQDAYDGCLVELDQEIHRLLTELERRGELQNTIVIITADHGEQFGEHGIVSHGQSLYRQVLHVPLMVITPGKDAGGKRVGRVVSSRDLPATILELLGLEQASLPGDSFAALVCEPSQAGLPRASTVYATVSGRSDYPQWWPNSSGSVGGLWTDDLHYIKEYGTGTEELYDVSADRKEEVNLAGSPEHADVLRRCRQALSEIDVPKE